MSLPRELVRSIRGLDEYQLRRLLIFVRGLLIGSDGPAVELTDVPGIPAVTYRSQLVRCGKECSACPHGPYWYAFWKEDGRSRSQYIGGVLPADIRRLIDVTDEAAAAAARDNASKD